MLKFPLSFGRVIFNQPEPETIFRHRGDWKFGVDVKWNDVWIETTSIRSPVNHEYEFNSQGVQSEVGNSSLG